MFDIWIVFTFWLLQTMLLSTFTYKILCDRTFSFLLGEIKYQEVEFLGHIITMCLIFWGADRLFSKVAVPFCVSPQQCVNSSFSMSLSTLVIIFFNSSHPSHWEVVSYCGSDWHGSWYWAFFYGFSFVYPLWRNVYSEFCLLKNFG